MTDFVDPIVIAQINGAKDELVAEVAKLQPAVTKIENYAGSLDSAVPEAPIDGKQYARKDAAWVEVSGGSGGDAVWGGITGTLSAQTDLQAALDLKANDSAISTVGKTGQYSDLAGKPSIIPEAPNDGKQYARKNLGWAEVAAAAIPTNPVLNGITNFKSGLSGSVFTDIASNGSSFGFQSPNAFDTPYEIGFKCDSSGMVVYVGGSVWGRVYKGNDVPASDNKQYVRKNQAWSELVAPTPTVTWGSISGTLSAQTDLQNALNAKANTTALAAKQDKLVSGTNIKTINGNSLLGSGDLVISGGGGAAGFDAVYAQTTQLELSGALNLGGGPRYSVPSATVESWANKRVYITATATNWTTLKIFTLDAIPATLPLGTVIILDIRGDVVKGWDRFEVGGQIETANLKKFDGTVLTSAMNTTNMHIELVLTQQGINTKKWVARSVIIN